MAQTLTTRKLRAVGTAGGSPPYVESHVAGEAIAVGDVVVLVPGSGKVIKANGTILVSAGTNDRIDISDLTDAGEGFIAGVALGVADADLDVISVAMAGPGQLFEANLQSTADGSTVVDEALEQLHVGDPVAVVLLDTGIYVVSNDESTETAGVIVRAGYGFKGENVNSGHGIVGDTNARVTFKFIDSLTLLGQ